MAFFLVRNRSKTESAVRDAPQLFDTSILLVVQAAVYNFCAQAADA
jgi:hypothetical protein